MNEQALEYARETGYLTTAGGAPEIQELRDVWKRECGSSSMPYVEVLMFRDGMATLAWNVKHLSRDIARSARKLVRAVHVEWHPEGAILTMNGNGGGSLGPVAFEDAKELALQIAALVSPDRVA